MRNSVCSVSRDQFSPTAGDAQTHQVQNPISVYDLTARAIDGGIVRIKRRATQPLESLASKHVIILSLLDPGMPSRIGVRGIPLSEDARSESRHCPCRR